MGRVLDAADAFADRRAVAAFARLTGIADAQERALRDNPDKFLRAAGEEVYRLRRAIEEAYEVLHPSMSFVPPGAEGALDPTVFRVDHAQQCSDAGDILWRAMGR